MSSFPRQLGVTYNEAAANPTFNGQGERAVTVQATYRQDPNYSSSVSVQYDILTAATLIRQLKEAIESHYFDSLIPRAPKDVV